MQEKQVEGWREQSGGGVMWAGGGRGAAGKETESSEGFPSPRGQQCQVWPGSCRGHLAGPRGVQGIPPGLQRRWDHRREGASGGEKTNLHLIEIQRFKMRPLLLPDLGRGSPLPGALAPLSHANAVKGLVFPGAWLLHSITTAFCK